jgi:hypothetical protein
MSTAFKPIEIPPGCVAKATKKMMSSNWAEVNLVRWRESQLSPVGGQSKFSYTFASPARKIHGWYDLNGIYRIAFLCEQHLYVDTGGVLADISPTSPVIPPPPAPTSGGYGDGAYSDGTYNYNEPPPIPTAIQLDKIPNAFSLDNFGAILYAMVSYDGRLLKWDPAVGGAAIVQPADSGRGPVPTGRCFVVTPERFVMIFGAYDATNGGGPRRFAWCDQENPGAWDYASVTSQAGFLDIEPASPIITALSTRNGILFWTGKKAYVSRFLGMPYIYNYTELADSTTPWSPQSMVNTSSMALWMSEQGAFSFDGTSILPVQCMVRPWVDDDIDPLFVREKACAVHVENFNEWWWFYPQNGQASNTRAIIYSYKEGWWSQARMARSAGVSAAYNAHTIMANGTVAYKHEDGVSYSVDATLPFAETFGLNIANGSRLVTVKQLLPDIEGAAGSIQYRLFYRNSRVDLTDPVTGFPLNPEQATPPAFVRPNGYVDLRATGRDVRLRMEVIGPSVLDFTLGAHQLDVVVRGDR